MEQIGLRPANDRPRRHVAVIALVPYPDKAQRPGEGQRRSGAILARLVATRIVGWDVVEVGSGSENALACHLHMPDVFQPRGRAANYPQRRHITVVGATENENAGPILPV